MRPVGSQNEFGKKKVKREAILHKKKAVMYF